MPFCGRWPKAEDATKRKTKSRNAVHLLRRGGIYGRRLELRVEPAPADAPQRAAALSSLLQAGETFALLGVFLPRAEAELTAVAAAMETPLVGPFTLLPQIDPFDWNPWVFYLLPGLEDLALSLVSFAGESPEPPRAAVLAGTGTGLDSAAQAIVRRATELGWPEVRTLSTTAPRPDLEVLAEAEIDTVLSAARVLIEALKRSGRELSRARLVEVLEGFSELDTGLVPPITYGANRRVGVRGAYVVTVDPAAGGLVPASGWIAAR